MTVQKKLLTLGAAFSIATAVAQADTVITKDDARLTGTITLIDEGVIHLETKYAGTLEILQEEVTSFQTDEPVFVRLASGTTMSGPVQSSKDGKLKIQSEDGVLETDTARVTASWTPENEDPAIVALREKEESMRRKWKLQGGINMLGKDGNSDEFKLGIRLDAKLKSPDDELAFFAEYEDGEKNDEDTDDLVKGGTSYESFFSEHYGWYIRTELESDGINQIDLRSTSGSGISFRLINNDNQTLVLRSGLGYRYTSFDDDSDNESSSTLDFGLAHTYKYKDYFALKNDLTYVPSTDDFGNYTATQDSGVEIPIGNGDNWKLRMGIKNEYDSEPAAEEKLDTTYYTRMIFSWE